jgi:hypothetical protein
MSCADAGKAPISNSAMTSACLKVLSNRIPFIAQLRALFDQNLQS